MAWNKASSIVLLLACSSPTTTTPRSAVRSMPRSSGLSPNAQTYSLWASRNRATRAVFTAAVTTKPSAIRPPPTTLTFPERPSRSSTFSQTSRNPQVITTAPTCCWSATSCNNDIISGCMSTADATSWQRRSKSWSLLVSSYSNMAWRKAV